MKLTVYGETNVGRHREHNEDAFLIICDLNNKWQEVNHLALDLVSSKGLFLVVADGMGGTNAGEIASSLAVKKVAEKVRFLKSYFTDEQHVRKYLTSIVFEAHTSIVKKARGSDALKGMGTTIVLGYIVGNLFHVVWAGDSRVYLYNASRYKQLIPFSDDHSIVWSRVKNGEITPEEARLSDDSNLILNALGDSFQKPIPEFKKTKLESGDRIILCSDGLNSMLSSTGIQQIIDFNSNTKDTCQALISAACKAGGQDNITVIVIDVLEAEPSSGETPLKIHKNRKWFKIGLILLLIAIGTFSIFYFSKEIKSFLHNYLNLDISEEIKMNDGQPGRIDENTPTASEKGDIPVNNSEVSENLETKQLNLTPSKEKPFRTTNTDLVISTSEIKEKLETEYKRIALLKTDLIRYKPGGDMYLENEAFCLANEIKINRIISKLDSIKGQIETVVYAPGNIIVSVTDQNKAIEILKILNASVNKLDAMKEEILISTNN